MAAVYQMITGNAKQRGHGAVFLFHQIIQRDLPFLLQPWTNLVT